jgi:hypothetical protein
LTTLWVTVVVCSAVAIGLADAHFTLAASRNRVILMRAEWARNACTALLVASFRPETPMRSIDSLDLGSGTWCSAVVASPSGRLNVNLASGAQLRRFFGDTLAEALIDWMDSDDTTTSGASERAWYAAQHRELPRNGLVADVTELPLVRGFESVSTSWLEAFLTVHGDGRIDPNLARPEIMASLPWFSIAEVTRLASTPGGQLYHTDELLSLLPQYRRDELAPDHEAIDHALVFESPYLEATIVGAVAGHPVRARASLGLIIESGRRLAVVQQRLHS